MSCHYFVFVIFMLNVCENRGQDMGYSYHKFSGPVSGDIHQVSVPQGYQKNSNQQTFDYVAKPNYEYMYGVEDPTTGNVQSHQESHDGDVVSGQYSVMEPDGTMRVVKYTADDVNGFQVQVEYIKPHEQLQNLQQHQQDQQ